MNRPVLDQAVLERFHDSFERCRERGDFYERFISSSDEVRDLFEGVDLARTKKMAKDALLLLMIASGGWNFGEQKIQKLATFHQSKNVKPRHYQIWLESLLSIV